MNKFKITIDENNFDVTVNVTDHDKATVEVNGISYEVSYESKNTVATTAPRKPAAIPTSTTYKSSAQSTSATSNKTTCIKAPLPGTISAVSVKVGSQVKRGDCLLVMEAMKMENEILAPHDGTVAQVIVSKGSTVETDSPLIVLA